MKKIILSLIFIFTFQYIFSQSSKSINIITAGTLKDNISLTEQKTVATLTVSGNIDARDFAFMRDKIQSLSILDLSASIIKSYSGNDGTYTGISTAYAANEIPIYAFFNPLLFAYKSSLTSIKFPSTTTKIGTQAFYYSWNLAGTINIPASLTSIADYAFYGCSSIATFTVANSNSRYSASNGVLFDKKQDSLFIFPPAKSGSYTIPTTVKHIGASAFENCYNLTSILIPNTITSIGSYAFSYCSGISGALTLPTSLRKLGEGAFYGCWNLTSVTIPATLTDIGYYCFLESNSVTAFNVNVSNPDYVSVNGMLMSKNQDTLFICPPAKTGTITIPSTVKLIGSYAFYNCTKISGTLTIPASVDYIGYYAFYNCSLISSFEVNPQNLYFTAENGVLFSKTKDRLLVYPVAKSGVYQMPSTIKTIDPAAFAFCSSITGTLQLPASVTSIGLYAFYNCTQISALDVDAGNTEYSSDNGVLYKNEMDTLLVCPLGKSGNYTIPENVKYVSFSAFNGCSNITSITFPTTLTGIGNYAFAYCTGLNKIQIPKSTSNIANGAFYSCTNLVEISIINPEPPRVDYYTFDLVNKSTCNLIVPIGAKSTYQTLPYWSEFINISESEFSNKIEVQKTDQHVYVQNYGIMVEKIKFGELIEIYSIDGRKLISEKASQQKMFWKLPLNSIYLVKISNNVYKISL
jgi:hypothetical protein